MNERLMKIRGENKIWKDVTQKGTSPKQVSSTQIGQKMILEESARIEPMIQEWIDKKVAKTYRTQYQIFFKNDDNLLLTKIAEVQLILAGTIYLNPNPAEKKTIIKNRHKHINTIQKHLFKNESFDFVWRFVEIVVYNSVFFSIDSELTRGTNTYSRYIKYKTSLSEEICSKLILKAADAFYPLPMVTPPKKWSYVISDEQNGIEGGYSTFQYDLIRTNTFKVDYSKQGQKIFDAVNYIQSVPWKVNKPLLHEVKNNLKPPLKSDFVKATYPNLDPAKFDLDLTEGHLGISKKEIEKLVHIRNVIKEQIQLYNAEVGDFESAVGKYRAVKLAVEIAEKFVDKTIYFPHSYDFRGRIYPLPIGLSPQGSDAVKSMLEYKRGEKLNESGGKWMWAYLATLYGDDKIQFNERVERGKELIDTNYREADEPYQFLAHQLDIKKWLENPNKNVTARIHLDACNSGSQFTSAITGDLEGCKATNVIPTYYEGDNGLQERKDAYLLVANKALDLSLRLAKSSKLKEDRNTYQFFSRLLEESGRKICKIPVMVSNYGGTTGGRTEMLWNLFREMKVERKWINRKIAAKFSRIIGESIHGVLSGGKAFELYIHQMNNIISKNNKPIYWDTSDGFHVVHVKNKELKPRRIQCLLAGSRRITTITQKVFSDNVNPAKMKSAIAPNYIHSLDAELLRRVALRLSELNIIDSDWIHDSFGCLPNNVDRMLDITKDEFAKLSRREPLKILDAQLRKQAGTRKSTLTQLYRISMPKLRGFSAKRGGLDIVMHSDWFFS